MPETKAWCGTREFTCSLFAGTRQQPQNRSLEFRRRGLLPRRDEPTALAGSRTLVDRLPTGVASDGARSETTEGDATRAELPEILRRAGARTVAEAREVAAEAGARAERTRTGIVARATETRIEIVLSVVESLSRPAYGLECV